MNRQTSRPRPACLAVPLLEDGQWRREHSCWHRQSCAPCCRLPLRLPPKAPLRTRFGRRANSWCGVWIGASRGIGTADDGRSWGWSEVDFRGAVAAASLGGAGKVRLVSLKPRDLHPAVGDEIVNARGPLAVSRDDDVRGSSRMLQAS